jgi:hypothetical protein
MATYTSDRSVVKLGVRSRDVDIHMQPTRTHHPIGGSDYDRPESKL